MLFDAVGEGAATKARNAQGREVDARPRGAPLDRHRNLTGIGIGELVKRECRSEEHTSELQSLMRISYAVFCLKKKTQTYTNHNYENVSETMRPELTHRQ